MNLIGKFLIFINLYIQSLSAQIVITASVDKQVVPINDNLTLIISIKGENVSSTMKPDLSGLSDFNIYASATNTNISWVNGHMSTTFEYIYTLTPKKTGKFIIPRIPIFTGRDKYFTQEISVEVVPPQITNQNTSSQPQRKKTNTNRGSISRENLVFVKAWTDKKSAYIGEQINLKVRFYTAIPISSNPQYYAPSYTNLISEDIPFTTGTEDINGITYYFIEVKTALFGIMAGKATISKATIEAYTSNNDVFEIDPFDPNFIQKFFSTQAQQKIKLETNPITLDIKPLPTPPDNFSNAVGNFTITQKLDETTIKEGEAINFTVEINGKGNIKSINPPNFSSNDFKLYDTLSSQNITKNNGIIGGTKKFTYIIAPTKDGELTIPLIKFTFFNIDTKKYETVTTSPVKINVLKSASGKTYDFDQTQQPIKEITKKEDDISYIYESIKNDKYFKVIEKLSSIKTQLTIILIIIIAINYLIIIRKNTVLSDPLNYAFKNAMSSSNKRIKQAIETFDKNKKNSLSIIYDLIYDYFSSKLKENITHLPFSKVCEKIKTTKNSFSDELINRFKKLIERLEFLNYTSTDIDKKEFTTIVDELKDILEKAEKEFKK